MSRIWSSRPAQDWKEAHPLGNGKIGAMVFGKTDIERISLNEETLWYGRKMNRLNPDAKKYLPEIRRLIFAGKTEEAERLLRLAFTGCPESMHPYQTLGDLYLRFNGIRPVSVAEENSGYAESSGTGNCGKSRYERSLDLSTAVETERFTQDGVVYKREYFVTAPGKMLVCRYTADRPGMISLEAKLRRGQEKGRIFGGTGRKDDRSIALWGTAGDGGCGYEMRLTGTAEGGETTVIGETLVVSGADSVILTLSAATTWEVKSPAEYNEKILLAGKEKEYEALKQEHISDYRSYFDRMSLRLGSPESHEDLSAPEMILRSREGNMPPELAETYFDFGRYLLISCSRPGTLPATLQGLWCEDLEPRWDSKYTININTEMNYWPAEMCGLSDCHMPLFDLIDRMVPNGEKTARDMYGCRGFVAHHNTDMFGDTDVQDQWLPGSYWVMGAAWLCTHQWTHYMYTKDLEFLKRTFPVMREAAQFFLDFLVEKDGYLVTCPSVSPENTFIRPDGQKGSNTAGVAMDNQILRDLFGQCIQAAEILGIDDDLNGQIKAARGRLRPDRVMSDGRLMEWDGEYEEAEPGHRHVSHLYGLYPSGQISVDKTPELAEAAEKTLERRVSMGGGHTGWSAAWLINLYGSLRDSTKAYAMLEKLFRQSTMDESLLDTHPGSEGDLIKGTFQIDGNFGATAGIARLVVQAQDDRVLLLPALPKQWPEGEVRGLRLPGDAGIDLAWKDGKVTRCVIKAGHDWNAEIVTDVKSGRSEKVSLRAGETAVL
ncbi:MAG: glycosyl hydrolase family 95 catalytic domain-containing protein [Lachnospiraceae bacterium]